MHEHLRDDGLEQQPLLPSDASGPVTGAVGNAEAAPAATTAEPCRRAVTAGGARSVGRERSAGRRRRTSDESIFFIEEFMGPASSKCLAGSKEGW